MAGIQFDAPFQAVNANNAAWKTLCEVTAPANHAVKVLEIVLGGLGISGTEVPFEVALAWTDGDGTGTAITLVHLNSIYDGVVTLQTSALGNLTAESLNPTRFGNTTMHAQGGRDKLEIMGDLIIGGGDTLAVQVFAAATTTALSGYVRCEE